MKLLGINLEYIQKHTPEDNGDIESFHNSVKTDYIWPYEFRGFHEASMVIGKAFTDYNECRPHSSVDYFPLLKFKLRFQNHLTLRKGPDNREIELTLDETLSKVFQILLAQDYYYLFRKIRQKKVPILWVFNVTLEK